MLLPMIEQSRPTADTVVTADAGYHSDANIQAVHDRNIAALIADNQMRQRDERLADQGKHRAKGEPLYDKQPLGQSEKAKWFRPKDFEFHGGGTCTCPAGKTLVSTGTIHGVGKGLRREDFKARAQDCGGCTLRDKCLRHPDRTAARKVAVHHPRQVDPGDPSARMRAAIDTHRGRALYSQRLGTVEPVFANLRHNKRLSRFTLRGQAKVHAQWQLYCMVHNIEKLAHSGWQT